MASRRAPLAHSALLLLAACSCACTPAESSTSPPASTYSSEAARAAARFQANYDAELRADDHSFLTAVAGVYLPPGRSVALAPDRHGAWVASHKARVRATATDTGLELELDGKTHELSERTLLPIGDEGRFALMCSPQEASWRVLIHDRDAAARREFGGIAWFPIDERFVVEARYLPVSLRTATLLQTSRGETKTLYLAGQLHFELGGAPQELQAFAYAPEPSAAEELLVPFKDATTGRQSYGAGRYLELEAPASEGALTLDFNRATNPLCAYNKHYNCPMPPRFNALELELRVGAQTPPEHSN